MRYQYKIFSDPGLVIYRVDGDPLLGGVRTMYKTFVADPLYRPHYQGLADWRGVVSHLSRKDVLEIAKIVLEDQQLKGFWVGLVSKPISTALAEVYRRKVSDQHSVVLCSTVEKASDLLGFAVEPYLSQLTNREWNSTQNP